MKSDTGMDFCIRFRASRAMIQIRGIILMIRLSSLRQQGGVLLEGIVVLINQVRTWFMILWIIVVMFVMRLLLVVR